MKKILFIILVISMGQLSAAAAPRPEHEVAEGKAAVEAFLDEFKAIFEKSESGSVVVTLFSSKRGKLSGIDLGRSEEVLKPKISRVISPGVRHVGGWMGNNWLNLIFYTKDGKFDDLNWQGPEEHLWRNHPNPSVSYGN